MDKSRKEWVETPGMPGKPPSYMLMPNPIPKVPPRRLVVEKGQRPKPFEPALLKKMKTGRIGRQKRIRA